MPNSRSIFFTASMISAIVGAGAASAADLPPKIYNWSGFYAGFNNGYAFNNKSRDAIIANDPVTLAGIAGDFVPTSIGNRAAGFTGGGQIGYNHQFHSGAVVGIESDAAYIDVNHTSDVITSKGFDTQLRSELGFLGTVRGRLGHAFENGLLVYGTGGFAYGNVANSMINLNRVGIAGYVGSQNSVQTGYAYGGGVEYALPLDSTFNPLHAPGVSVKVEYMHYDLGTSSFFSDAVPGVARAGSSFTNSVQTHGDLVRAGLNFKFGVSTFAMR
jgi:outer membrane immunogenic protein